MLHFYGKDYKIETLTATQLVVSLDGERTTYERNSDSNTSTTKDCTAKFQIEGANDAKGIYTKGNTSWTIHFSDEKQNFIAFHTANGKADTEVFVIEEVKKGNGCNFHLKMEGISGEIVPQWTLKYNEAKKYYDLKVHSYDAKNDSWNDTVFTGSKDNG